MTSLIEFMNWSPHVQWPPRTTPCSLAAVNVVGRANGEATSLSWALHALATLQVIQAMTSQV